LLSPLHSAVQWLLVFFAVFVIDVVAGSDDIVTSLHTLSFISCLTCHCLSITVSPPIFSLQVVLLGDTNTGKTCLVLRFVEGYYKQAGRSSTIGAFFLTKRLTVNSITCKMMLWDTAGQEAFQKLAVTYYKSAAAAILCYDVTNPRSLVKLRSWLEQVRANTSPIVIAIAACKTDLEAVPGLQEEGRKLAQAEDALYFETSAKRNINVHEVFHQTAERVLQWQEQAELGYAAPLTVTLGGVTRHRSLSPKIKQTMSIPVTPPEPEKLPDQESAQSTANESDDVVDDDAVQSSHPRVMCEGGLMPCGGDDTRGCCIL
jgi:Ras-related protein Rab-5C